jgi:3-oxoacyl-[acyl-carrier-protein] synthase II
MKTVITAWETLSPLGCGADEHARRMRDRTPVNGGGPGVVAGFDVRQALGSRGTRSMCRATGLAVATTGQLLARASLASGRRTRYADDEIGLVLATSDNVQTLVEYNRDTWIRSRPYDVDPAQVPVLLMNVHASQCAIWHRLKGPNSTICGGHLGCLLALSYARRLQRRGHARAVLCGAVEEYSGTRAAYVAARAGDRPRRPLGEGCVLFLLEDGDMVAGARSVLGEVLAVEFGFAQHDGAVRHAIVECLRRALATAQMTAAQVVAVAPSPALDARGDAERAAITEVFGAVRLLSGSLDALGDTHAVCAAFQIVELLADRGSAGAVAAVTATDTEGRVGCALLRMA